MENTTTSQPSTTDPSSNRNNLNRVRRALLVIVGIATVIAAFYAEEGWRGKHAWEQCKRRYEAKGYVMDWNALIPPPVPDEQNFFKAPKMAEWMVGRGDKGFSKPYKFPEVRTNIAIANVKVVSQDFNPGDLIDNIVLQYGDNNFQTNVDNFIGKILGPTLLGAMNWTFVSRTPDPTHLPTIFIQSSAPLSGTNLQNAFQKGRVFYHPPATKIGSGADFRLEVLASNSYRLYRNSGVFSADEYIASCDTTETNLSFIRAALERPYARMDGDYERPYDCPIPNFVTFRSISQMLSQRTQCYLLIHQPDKALEQLTFIHKLCEVLEARPTHKPMTLVAAMINVAIQGLYCQTIGDGIHLHAWNDAQLQELQKQLRELNVIPFVESALEGERISMGRTLRAPKAQVANLFIRFSGPGREPPTNAWMRWQNPLYTSIRLAPRGWFYQNMVSIADAMQPQINVFDIPGNQISPNKAGAVAVETGHLIEHATPYNCLVGLAIPNFIRAIQATGKNQSLINLAYLACALERYHLAHHEYPETLNKLVPQFADHIPHDIINGQPLHYHRSDDGQFKLYSVGWNEKDDNGTSGDNQSGDWVWQYPLQ